jgi:7-cyano-7-deazaguanine synthase
MSDHNRALVLFSGGQDSTTCLAWALDRFAHVETIGFDYGQRHRIELDVRPPLLASLRGFAAWKGRLGEDHLLDLTVLGRISQTSLTQDVAIAMNANGLPNTFVPGRNILFMGFAAATGYRRGLKHLVTGVCETDYSGYPDCRDDTMKSLQATLNLGMESRFVIHTPLMWRSDLGAGSQARRCTAGRADTRAHAQLLQRRPHPSPRLGLWLRHLPGLRPTRRRLSDVHIRVMR